MNVLELNELHTEAEQQKRSVEWAQKHYDIAVHDVATSRPKHRAMYEQKAAVELKKLEAEQAKLVDLQAKIAAMYNEA